MTKIVYNACFGGFGLSMEARKIYSIRSGISIGEVEDDNIPRTDPILVDIVEELGSQKASGEHARLCIRDLASGTKYRIDEYDGRERVMIVDDYNWETA